MTKANYAETPTLKVSVWWRDAGEEKRKLFIDDQFRLSGLADHVTVESADEYGNVELALVADMPAGARGTALLDIEEMLKANIDRGIVVWLSTKKDKNSLRNLRGVKV